jgi:chromosome partitioning protein
MNVITMVSCKAGTGKTTLTAQLAAYAFRQRRRCLVIDADPEAGFARLNARRAWGALPFATVRPVLDRQLEAAETLGYDWVLIDTAPEFSPVVREAVRVATMLIIPARPGSSDLIAVSQATDLVHGAGKPYAVVLNGVAMLSDEDEAIVGESRAWLERYAIPVWSGQISERPGRVPAAGEADARSLCEIEIAELWSMIDCEVEAMSAAEASVSDEKRAA